MTAVPTAIANDRRRLGTALLVYGAVGTVLFVGLLIGLLVAGSLLSDAPDRAVAGIDKVVAVLDSTGETLASLETTLGGAGQTLTTTADTIEGAASTLTGIGDSLHGIGTALTAFSILGATPLAAVGSTVDGLGDQVAGVGQQIGGLSTNLTTNASDVDALKAKLATLRSDLTDLEDGLASLDLAAAGRTIQLVRYSMLAIMGWLAVGSAGLAWFGWRLRRVPIEMEAAG